MRGAGLPDVTRLPYPPEMAIAALAGTKHLVLAGATVAGALLRLPGRARRTRCPTDCTVHVLSAPGEDGVAALQALARGRRARRRSRTCWRLARPELPTGELTPRAMAAVVGALLPENAIVVDEALTSGVGLAELTSGGAAARLAVA